MGLARPRRGVTLLPGSSSSSLKLPLPLALVCCFLFFYAGSFFGGRYNAGLPDTKQPKKRPVERGSAGGGEAQGRAATGGARRQLTSHQEASQLVLAGAAQEQQGQGGQGQAASLSAAQLGTVTVSLPPPYPHGATGEQEIEAVSMQMLSWQPRAYIFPGFAPAHICESIVALAKTQMHPSGLALRAGESVEGTRDIRTSSGAFLSSRGDPSHALEWVEKKMSRLTMIPTAHGEAFNVLRYEIGQHYDSHMDVFDPKEYGPQPSNRVASFLLYLTGVEEGGETMFPYEGGRNMNIGYNFKDCIGLRVKPRAGDALLFWSIMPNGTIDPTSLHGSCPVRKGEKWVATKWIRDTPTGF